MADLFSPEDWDGIIATLGLSRRESEAACLVVGGATDTQCATQLEISPHTVRTYLDRLFGKAGVKGRKAFVIEMIAMRDVLRSER